MSIGYVFDVYEKQWQVEWHEKLESFQIKHGHCKVKNEEDSKVYG